MNKYQLFRQIPSKEFVEDFIKLYGPNGFDEHFYFTLNDLSNNNIIENITNIIDDLKEYYLKCKWHYIENLSLKKTITILRQLLRIYDYKLNSCEKYKNGSKFLLYNIFHTNITNNIDKNLTIKFD